MYGHGAIIDTYTIYFMLNIYSISTYLSLYIKLKN